MSDVTPNSDIPELNELMDVLRGKRPDDPILATQKFIQTHPERSEGYFILGVLTYLSGYVGDALQMIEKAYGIDSDVREYAQALASLYTLSDRIHDGLYFGKLGVVLPSRDDMAEVLPPPLKNFVEAASTHKGVHGHYVAASLAFNRRAYGEVLEECDKELKMDPGYVPALELKVQALGALKDFAGPIPILNDLMVRNPSKISQYRFELANAFCHLGLYVQAREALEQAVSNGLGSVENNVLALSLLPMIPDSDALHAQVWAQLKENGIEVQEPFFPYEPSTDGKIRVGFLTDKAYGCFEGRSLSSILKFYDTNKFEIFVYVQNINEDSVTQDIFNRATFARDVYDINDKTLSKIIERDGVDVLVDMCGFGPNQRLALLAHQPSGARVSWLAPLYGEVQPGITHVVTDEKTHEAMVQTLAHDQIALCLSGAVFTRPPFFGYVDPVEPPVLEKKHVTFGVMLDFRALTGSDGQVWAQVLKQVPDSRLKVHVNSEVTDFTLARLTELFEQLDVFERIDLYTTETDPEEGEALGQFYNAIDVFLVSKFDDVNTIVEALWMGVPALTYVRNEEGLVQYDASTLRAAGIPSWACEDEETFVALATSLAQDHQELSGLRKALRQQLAGSWLMQPDRFSMDFQALMITLFQEYIAQDDQK